MNTLRFRIASLMGAVALAAFDSWAIPAMVDSYESSMLIKGALPMANILLIAFASRPERLRDCPFRLGFEVFGAMAVLFFMYWSRYSASSSGPIGNYLALLIGPTHRIFGLERTFGSLVFIGACGAIMLTWPQLAFALIGGLLSRRFEVSLAITRR